FARNCLLARRMVERGVRFVQLYHYTWDDHSHLNEKLKENTAKTDQPAAALLADLKQRGLLDDTLVIWGGEFGRTPMNEVRRGNTPGREGRDHHTAAFTMLLAGGGVRGGPTIGRTDELGYPPVESPIHVHDLQPTTLHAPGPDPAARSMVGQTRFALCASRDRGRNPRHEPATVLKVCPCLALASSVCNGETRPKARS